jgi:hypothetical protein
MTEFIANYHATVTTDEALYDRADQLQQDLNHRVQDPAFDALADMFGQELPTDDSRLGVLQDVAARNWDFRKGKERQDVAWEGELADPNSTAGREVFRHTGRLGLVASTHTILPVYDFGIVTGGANRSPLDRTRYLHEQAAEVDHVLMLGSVRPVNDAERAKAADYAPGATSEFDLMRGAAENVYRLGSYVEDRPKEVGYDFRGEARVYHYNNADGPMISVLDAPAPADPSKNRPNTVETYAFARELFGNELANADVLVSTNAHFSPFQHIDALGALSLPTGAQVETIGYDAAYGGMNRLPSQLLQETKSYVDAMARLDQSLHGLK